VHGELVVAWQRHNNSPLIIGNCKRQRAIHWTTPPNIVLPRVGAAGSGQFLLHDMRQLFVVDEDGAAQSVPVKLAAGQHISRACWWKERIAIDLYTERAKQLFHVAVVDVAGTETFLVPGFHATPRGDHLLVFDDGIVALDVNGAVAGRVDVRPESGNIGKEQPYAFVGDDVVVSTRNPSQIIRCTPATSTIVWSTELTASSLYLPVLVGADGVAASPGPYADDRVVSLVDVTAGSVVHSENAAGKISALCAVDGDAVIACSYTMKQVGWRNITTSADRLTLQAPAKIFDMVSYAKNVVVGHTGDDLVFWTL